MGVGIKTFIVLVSLSVGLGAVSTRAVAASCEFPIACRAYGSQAPDCSYNPSVEAPRYPHCDGPRIWVDSTHDNGQKITPLSVAEPGRFWGFGALLARDGFRLVDSDMPLVRLSPDTGPDILVIANAQSVHGTSYAFTSAEVDAITSWVEQGGALLLVFDHAPFDSVVSNLLSRFELELSPHGVDTHAKTVFRRSDGSLAGSAYASNGASDTDVVNQVTSFRGASFAVSATRSGKLSHTPLLTFPSGATGIAMGFRISLVGRLQGVEIKLGAGRVIVLAEAAMLSAQVSAQGVATGMHQTPGNEQFLLNFMHWLADTKLEAVSNNEPNEE